MISPTSGDGHDDNYLRVRLLDEEQRHRSSRLPHLGVGLVVAGDAVEDHDRLARRRAVLEADDREPPHRHVRVAGCELVEERSIGVDVAGMRSREPLERDQGRSAHRRAFVLEPAAQQLELLAETELGDRPVRNGPHPVVAVPGRGFDLVAPFAAKRRQLALEPALRRTRRRAPRPATRSIRSPAAAEGPGRRISRPGERAGRAASAP